MTTRPIKLEDVTKEQADFIFNVVVCSAFQEAIRETKNDWMLDFVYDSSLLEKLEKHYERLYYEDITKKEIK